MSINWYPASVGDRNADFQNQWWDWGAQSVHIWKVVVGALIANVSSETIPFWLTLEDKQSIEANINAKKPIGDTWAYRKFLAAIFPDTTPLFPYFSEYGDALKILRRLGELFGRKLGFPETCKEWAQYLKEHNHLTGYRKWRTGEIMHRHVCGYAWAEGIHEEGRPPVAFYSLYNDVSLVHWPYPKHDELFSVIPVFK